MGEVHAFDRLRDRLVVEHGRAVPGRPTVYSIMRNERFFLEAFFAHYRSLGIAQFVILDDGSTDGSVEFFRAQPDCVLLSSSLRYGQEIRVRMPDGRERTERAGVLFKRVIGAEFCAGHYGLYADADEFLVLPPAVPDVPALYARLAAHSVDAVVASLPEFYPETVAGLRGEATPRSYADLIGLYPYFDAVPLVRFRPGIPPKRINGSASRRLFARYGITRPPAPSRWLPGWADRWRGRLPGKSATMKTPIVRWREGVWIEDTHRSNVRPSSDVLVAFAHFKFNHRLAQKTEEALRLRSYSGKSEKYELYAELMMKMIPEGASFIGPDSRRCTGPQDLAEAGLTAWRLD
ncbi:MAG: glycosyltransferase family 2 protein [Steroidobacteraceae bacterium]